MAGTDPGGGEWVATETAGGGDPLVLIHGVGTDRTIWARTVPILAERWAVTVLDMPGFGASPAPTEWSLEGAAERIAATLETDIGGRFDLVGSSLGGAVALVLAASRPELVERLVLVSPAGFRPLAGPLARAAALAAGPLLAARRRAGLSLAERATARRALLAGTVADGAALDPEAARLLLRASRRAPSLGPALRAAAEADLRGRAAQIGPPGLIWGDLDRVVGAHVAERILEIHPEAPLEVVGGAGHVPHLERPAEFAAALERVLSQLP